MKRFAMAAAAAALPLYPLSAAADSQAVGVEQPWARATIGANRPGAVYLQLRNDGDRTATVTGLRTDIAAMADIHRSTTTAEGVSSMAPAGPVPVGPGETVMLEPGGLHAMLMGLTAPLAEGDRFTLTIIFADGGEVPVQVPVLGIAARGPAE